MNHFEQEQSVDKCFNTWLHARKIQRFSLTRYLYKNNKKTNRNVHENLLFFFSFSSRLIGNSLVSKKTKLIKDKRTSMEKKMEKLRLWTFQATTLAIIMIAIMTRITTIVMIRIFFFKKSKKILVNWYSSMIKRDPIGINLKSSRKIFFDSINYKNEQWKEIFFSKNERFFCSRKEKTERIAMINDILIPIDYRTD